MVVVDTGDATRRGNDVQMIDQQSRGYEYTPHSKRDGLQYHTFSTCNGNFYFNDDELPEIHITKQTVNRGYRKSNHFFNTAAQMLAERNHMLMQILKTHQCAVPNHVQIQS